MPWCVSFRFQNTDDCGPLLVQRGIWGWQPARVFSFFPFGMSLFCFYMSPWRKAVLGLSKTGELPAYFNAPGKSHMSKHSLSTYKYPALCQSPRGGQWNSPDVHWPRSCTLQSLSCCIHEGIQDQYH